METTKTNCDVEMPNPGIRIATKGGWTIKSRTTVNCKRARMAMTNFCRGEYLSFIYPKGDLFVLRGLDE
jgi:hypothetical protein